VKKIIRVLGIIALILLSLLVIVIVYLFVFSSNEIPVAGFSETSEMGEIECSSDIYNCGDFTDCDSVMGVFSTCKSLNSVNSSDIHRLDVDGDGIPCESLCGV